MIYHADLHMHSCFSDGMLTPTELVREAAARGVTVLSLTDHDSCDGVLEAMTAGRTAGVSVVPGVEFSTMSGGRALHLLGYFMDFQKRAFVERLAEFQRLREGRIAGIVEKLGKLGVHLDFEHVRRRAMAGTMGRPHVAMAMLDHGYVASLQDGFDRYLGFGKPAYLEKPSVPAADLAGLIREAGGLVVLAHPGTTWTPGQIRPLIGPILDGIEAFHASHRHPIPGRIIRLCRDTGACYTGGSDFHAFSVGRASIGERGLTQEDYEAFAAHGRHASHC